jgi:ribose 1,5-bisphosphokinase PhnN
MSIFDKSNKQKTITMYQVIIKEDGSSRTVDFPTLAMANQSLLERASEQGLAYDWDADGWAYAWDSSMYQSPFRTEMFIFKVEEDASC